MPTTLLLSKAACFLGVLVLIPLVLPAAPAGEDWPAADALPARKDLPDPFLFKDGSRVKTKADWERRRAELKDMVLYYEYGRMPGASPVSVTEAKWIAPPPDRGIPAEIGGPVSLPAGAAEMQFRLSTGPGGKVSTSLIITTPAGPGPFPVIVKGDLNWGRVHSGIVAAAVGRGYILAEFDRNEIAPDKDDRTAGVFPLYPDFDWRTEAAWAWGYHRVVDYLLTRPDVDKTRVAVTGHSRGGKAALLAGALDERIALTCPNGSGCGGAGSYHHQAPKSEDVGAITSRFPHWFHPRLNQFVGLTDRLPFDQHEVIALVAPRAYLSTEALGDLWANPEGTQVNNAAAREVFKFLGAGDRVGIHYREGKHDQNVEDWAALLDYADRVIAGKAGGRSFDRSPFLDAPKMRTWEAPPAP